MDRSQPVVQIGTATTFLSVYLKQTLAALLINNDPVMDDNPLGSAGGGGGGGI